MDRLTFILVRNGQAAADEYALRAYKSYRKHLFSLNGLMLRDKIIEECVILRRFIYKQTMKVCYSCGSRFKSVEPTYNWQDCPECEAAHSTARRAYLASSPPSSEGGRAASGEPGPPPPTTKEPLKGE